MMFQAVESPTYIMVKTAILVVPGSGEITGSTSANAASPASPNPFSGPARPSPLIRTARPGSYAIADRDAIKALRPDDEDGDQDHEEDEAGPDRRSDHLGDGFG